MKRGIDYIGVGVGAILVNGRGQIFLARRGPTAKNERGLWEFPGGSVEFGETLADALRREMREEYGIEIIVGEYEKAVKLYGGGYEALVDFHPSLDPEDHRALLENGCEINGLQCLAVLTADFKRIDANGTYLFVVQFKDGNGDLSVRQALNAPPVFIFEYHVQKTPDGKFVVLDLPVYVP